MRSKTYFFLIILIMISVVSHLEWFNLSSILTAGDWLYKTNESLAEFPNYGPWLSFASFGSPNIQLYFNIFYLPWSILINLGFSFDLVSKLNLFIPLAVLGFLSPYFLSKELVKDNYIAFVSSLFYGSTTYFLGEQRSHLPIAFLYALTPLIFLAFIKALQRNKLVYWLLFSAIYSIGVGYEARIMYIVSFLLLLYFLYFHLKNLKKYFKNLILTFSFIILLNLYWFLPTLLGGISGSIEAVAGRDLFGDSLANILRGFTISQWSWTGGLSNSNFDPQPIMTHFWILPVFIFSTFLLKDNKYLKQTLFFLGISLLGILLVKQSGPPFAWLYNFLRDFFPGFVLFRESSKLYLIVAFGYLGLLVYGLKLLSEKLAHKRSIFFILCLLLIALFSWNLKPLVTQEYRTVFVSREIPKEYIGLKKSILGERKSYRVLWTPIISIWSFYNTQNPRASFVGLVGNNWKLFNKPDSSLTTGQKLIRLLNQKFANKLLDISSVKYLVVPILSDTDLESKLFENYGEPREYYIKELDKLPYLQKVNLGTGDLVVYENKDYRPRIYITHDQEAISKEQNYQKVDLEIVNSAEYKVGVKKAKKPFYLNFSESYHKNWKLRVGEFNWLNALIDKNYFVSEKNHFENDAFLNSYFINPESICSQVACEKNNDGSYDITLTLYFISQSWFYLGLILSAVALFFLSCILFFVLIKNFHGRRRK